MHGIAIADDIWFTCCAFHNMLLHEDGLDRHWKKGRRSEYEGELGWHEVGDVETYAPLIFRRVNSGMTGNLRILDSSRLGRNDNEIVFDGNDSDDESIDLQLGQIATKKCYNIKNMTNRKFRNHLVTSFHVRWAVRKIAWPSRTGKMDM
jgi:hypothetical protein